MLKQRRTVVVRLAEPEAEALLGIAGALDEWVTAKSPLVTAANKLDEQMTAQANTNPRWLADEYIDILWDAFPPPDKGDHAGMEKHEAKLRPLADALASHAIGYFGDER